MSPALPDDGDRDRPFDVRADVRWREGILITIGLWSFTLLVYLPMIVARYDGMGLRSVALDSSTVLVSMLLAMPLFALFRWTYGMANPVRLGAMIPAVLTAAIVQSLFDLVFTAIVANNLEAGWLTLPNNLSRSYGAAFNYAAVFAVNCALFQLAAGRRRTLRHGRELAEIRAAAKQAEVDALRLRLNPHFLFNTLNAISAMVVTHRNAEAEQALEQLSRFLRVSIDSDPTASAALDDQLQLVDHYLQLEEMRFGERLSVAFDCEGDVGGAVVPPLLIQPLVEAAIRDGVEPSVAPVHVTIAARWREGALDLSVSDDAPRAETREAALTVAALRGRLAALYGAAASVDVLSGERGVTTTLHMPVATA